MSATLIAIIVIAVVVITLVGMYISYNNKEIALRKEAEAQRGKIESVHDKMWKTIQELVFKTVIQRNVKLSESPSHGLPVILYDADSTGSKNHLALAKEIINKC